MTASPTRWLAAVPALLVLLSTAFASLEALLGPELTTAEGKTIETSALQGKTIGLYFSAAWCRPCVNFTPLLAKLRKAHADEFEVVLVSSDRNAAAMRNYMERSAMPWPAVPFDAPQRSDLQSHFEVRGIPRLVILDDQGRTLANNGVTHIRRDPATALRQWQAASPQTTAPDLLNNLEEQTKHALEQGFQQLRLVNESAGDLMEKIQGLGGIFGLGAGEEEKPEE